MLRNAIGRWLRFPQTAPRPGKNRARRGVDTEKQESDTTVIQWLPVSELRKDEQNRGIKIIFCKGVAKPLRTRLQHSDMALFKREEWAFC